jgi:hypothetical protein
MGKVTVSSQKKCHPFILDVFVASPEAGYKFNLLVEKACSPDNDPLWKLVFELYKKNAAGTDDLIVRVLFDAVDPLESQGVQNLVVNPISTTTATILSNEAYPTAKAVAGVQNPTPDQKKAINDSLSKAAISAAK